MTTVKRSRVMVATDGSRDGQAAVAMAAAFSWPAGSGAHAVVALGDAFGMEHPTPVRKAVDESLSRVADEARRVLARRWPGATAAVVRRPAIAAILGEARRVRATAIVVGSRGHGAVGRFLFGSVSHAVVRGADTSVLVVKGRPRTARRLVVGLDGSPNSRRALDLVARLDAPRAGRVTLARVVPPEQASSRPLLPPAAMAIVRSRMAVLNAERVRAARRDLEAAGRVLRRAGWRVRTIVRTGAPLDELLVVVRQSGADLLVVGARGVGGLKRLLLGSVAEGALNHAPGPVLIVR